MSPSKSSTSLNDLEVKKVSPRRKRTNAISKLDGIYNTAERALRGSCKQNKSGLKYKKSQSRAVKSRSKNKEVQIVTAVKDRKKIGRPKLCKTANSSPHCNPDLKSNTKYKCKECHKSFVRKQFHDFHYIKKHVKYEWNFVCEQCLIACRDEKDYKEHIKIHEGMTPSYQCELCPESFCNYAGLGRHKLCHQLKPPFECTLCDLFFPDYPALAKHWINHPKFFCARCETFLETEEEYYYHKDIYHAEKSVVEANEVSKPAAGKIQDISMNEDEMPPEPSISNSCNQMQPSPEQNGQDFESHSKEQDLNGCSSGGGNFGLSNKEFTSSADENVRKNIDTLWNDPNNFLNSNGFAPLNPAVIGNWLRWLFKYFPLYQSLTEPFEPTLIPQMILIHDALIKVCQNPVGIVQNRETLALLCKIKNTYHQVHTDYCLYLFKKFLRDEQVL